MRRTKFEGIVKAIKEVRIQGATAVAKASLNALEDLINRSRARSRSKLLREVRWGVRKLFSTRSTEPLMRNCLRYCLYMLERSDLRDVEELRNLFSVVKMEILDRLERSEEKIFKYGSNLVRNYRTVFLHCHSSLVVGIVKKAFKGRRGRKVICTETRPLFQGRKTALELSKEGIPVTLIVDSAASLFMPKVDAVLVGCDAITSDLSIINKIGTFHLALLAKLNNKKFHVVTQIEKFDPETQIGKLEEIEKRDPSEVWKVRKKNLRIENYAFDVTPEEYISSLVTQEGIISIDVLLPLIREKYEWILKPLKSLKI